MKIKYRTLFVSVLVGVVLSALTVFGGVAEAACAGNPPSPPTPPMPCAKPADGCSFPSDVRPWQDWCCKEVGLNCYWVQIRAICCGTEWKWGYQDGTQLAFNCDNDTHACF